MINEVMDILVAMNLTPQKMTPTLIKFSKDSLNFVFQADMSNDPSYFRLMLPSVEHYSNDDSALNEKMINVSSQFKAGKCITVNDDVWLTIEAFSYESSALSSLIGRWIAILSDMIKYYREYGRTESSQQSA